MIRKRILIVEDDPEYQDWLTTSLLQGNFELKVAPSIHKARKLLKGAVPDLIILNANLPDGSGLQLCRDIRKNLRTSKVLVAILTAQRSIWSKDKWLQSGADTCWIKPLGFTRLVSLARGMVRRREWDTTETYPKLPGLSIDSKNRLIFYKGVASQKLSDKELSIMELLVISHPGTLSKEEIIDSMRYLKSIEQPGLAITQLISRLKKKLPTQLSDCVQAAYRKGYRLEISA